MAGVITDHYIQQFGLHLSACGLWMGGVFVTVFFALSAYLFGEKWRNQDHKKFEVIPFLRKRVLRIYIPLWISLILVIAIEYFVMHQFDLETILFNFIGAGWAKPFGVGGHLWYITMMMLLYVAFILFSYFRIDKLPLWVWCLALGLITLLYVLFPPSFSTFSKAGPPVILWFASLLFYKVRKAITIVVKYKIISIVISLVVILTSLLLYVFVPDWHFAYKEWATLTTTLAGLLLFLVLLSLLDIKKEPDIIKNLSKISYEVYLMHLPLLPLVGSFVVNELLFLPLWLILIFAGAYCLNKMSEPLIKMFNNNGKS